MTGLQKLAQKTASQNSQNVTTSGQRLNDLSGTDARRAMIEALKAEVSRESADTRNAALATCKGEW